MWPVRRVAVVGCDPRGRGGADELIREKRRAEWLFCELCYNSHPVIIFGPPSMTRRRVWASLGIRPESGLFDRLMSRFMSRLMNRLLRGVPRVTSRL